MMQQSCDLGPQPQYPVQEGRVQQLEVGGSPVEGCGQEELPPLGGHHMQDLLSSMLWTHPSRGSGVCHWVGDMD